MVCVHDTWWEVCIYPKESIAGVPPAWMGIWLRACNRNLERRGRGFSIKAPIIKDGVDLKTAPSLANHPQPASERGATDRILMYLSLSVFTISAFFPLFTHLSTCSPLSHHLSFHAVMSYLINTFFFLLHVEFWSFTFCLFIHFIYYLIMNACWMDGPKESAIKTVYLFKPCYTLPHLHIIHVALTFRNLATRVPLCMLGFSMCLQ